MNIEDALRILQSKAEEIKSKEEPSVSSAARLSLIRTLEAEFINAESYLNAKG